MTFIGQKWWHRFWCWRGRCREVVFIASDHRAKRCWRCKATWLLNDGEWSSIHGCQERPASHLKA